MKHKTVTDYLEALTWDSTPRVDRWLVDYARAEDTAYVRAVSRAMLVAAVRRARRPGCRFGQMPVIHGPQGSGKSQALRMLAVEDAWFCDEVAVDDARQVIETTAGKWIVETEMTGLSANAFKAFLSRGVDEARMTYQRDATRVPRSFVIVGTTHAGDYLPDVTTARRLWPVTVRRFDLGRLVKIRDQLWAEAAIAEAAGESIEIGLTP
jgi:predicted P-loop ATPase